VAKRLAAERARLEAQTRAQQTQPTAPTPATTTVAARPAPVETVQTPPPAPAPVETRPAPQPVQPAPVEPEPERPAPAPAVARAREGDLVSSGTEGLTPPRMTSRGTVTYPPLARNQRIQGTVVTSVLVSETGKVLDVKVIRGVNILNEAAVQAMRRSSFAPAMKDGVRVKSYVTVPVEFKL
jgi:protein TonB